MLLRLAPPMSSLDCSSTVTRIPASASSRADWSPANPPPMTTQSSGRLDRAARHRGGALRVATGWVVLCRGRTCDAGAATTAAMSSIAVETGKVIHPPQGN